MKSTTNIAPIFEERDEPKFKDGEEGGDQDLINVVVDIALNGYTVVYNFEDGSEEKYVHTDFDDVLKQLRSKH